MKRQQSTISTPNKSNQNKKGVFSMNKKRNSIIQLILCAVLAAMMIISMALPTLAADDIYSEGDNSKNPVKAAITKIFKMPINTETPKAEFEFIFRKDGMIVNGSLDATDKASLPDIGPVEIKFADGTAESYIYNGVKYLVKQSDNFITPDMIGDTVWKNGEGIYKYTVSETQSGIEINDDEKEFDHYSGAAYDVEIWVEEDEEGILFPKFVVVRIIAGSEDEYYIKDGEPEEGKVDPRPGEEVIIPGDPPSIEDFSQVIFTNKYWKTDGGGTENPDQTALEIIKVITGNGTVLSDRFSFDVTVTQPSVIDPASPAQKYQACVLNAAGTVITTSTHYAGTIEDGFFEVTSGTKFTVSLTNGERLAFVDLHVGSDVKVEEKADANYKAKYKRTFAGTINTDFTAPDKNTDWGFPRTTGTNPDVGPHYTLGGAKANIVTFTNMRSGATPTGISVDDLPFIVLIGVVITGLVIFMVFRIRKNAKHDV